MASSHAEVDVAAIRANVAHLASRTSAQVMAVVKADGYGHGLVPSARAALEGGATWLGVALLDEALALRAAGIDAPVLAWLWGPHEAPSLAAAIAAGIDVSVAGIGALEIIDDLGVPARIHLKIDTGLNRNGATAEDWPQVVTAAAKSPALQVVGVWSHFAYADAPGHPTIARQVDRFAEAVDVAERAGLRPQLRHLANSAATLTLPAAHFDLVRPGVAVYGLNPVPELPRPDWFRP
jgi:alanine racemase